MLGRQRFERLLLAQEALTTPIEELEKMAEQDLARNKAQYEELASKPSAVPSTQVTSPTRSASYRSWNCERRPAGSGDRFELGKFHDALLAHGAPPVPLIRDRVLEALGAH